MVKRRLAAILAADVVGYSRLMGKDETAALDALRELRTQSFEPLVTEYNGDVVKRMGDGWLVKFSSAAAAVACAIAVQEELADHDFIKLRIGIHSGDIVEEEEEDIYGDGVNIAARLQDIAAPRGITISDTVANGLDKRAAADFSTAGTRALKNIDRPVSVWQWHPEGEAALGQMSAGGGAMLNDLPRLYVGEIECADARPEVGDLVASLGKDFVDLLASIDWLDVRAGTPGAGDAGYGLRAKLRTSGDRLRLEVSLRLSRGGEELWRERVDGNLNEAFDWQDETAEKVCGMVSLQIRNHELQRFIGRREDQLSVHDWLMRGSLLMETPSQDNFATALTAFRTAFDMGVDDARFYVRALILRCLINFMGLASGQSD